ncbi:MAG: N-formylglutamate amidohydrolase [Candidatus Heimdallarchaeota archaeon]
MSSFKKQLEIASKTTEDALKGFIYQAGSIYVVLTAPHAQGPSSDLFTGEIAYRVGAITRSHVFISTLSREKLDLNLPSTLAQISPFRLELKTLIQRLINEHSEVLVIDIHGMEKYEGPDIYLGTLAGKTARIEVINLIIEAFEKEGFETWLAEYFEPSLIGGDITASISALGENIDAVQIEINQTHRDLGSKKIIHALVQVITQWNKKYGPVWGTASILRRITGVKFPIKSKNTLIRYLGGDDMEIHWAKGKRRKVRDIIDPIEEKWFPVNNPKDLIRIIRKSIYSKNMHLIN